MLSGGDTVTPSLVEVSPAQAAEVISQRKPLGLFYLLDGERCIGIDNTTGNAWTEEFTDLQQCKDWLQNPFIEIEWRGKNG